MQFNSYLFVFLFLPVFVAAYFIASKIRPVAGKLILILSSIIFFAYGRVNMLICLSVSVLVNYLAAIFIYRQSTKRKSGEAASLPIGDKDSLRAGAAVVIPCVINIAALFFFKYLGFTIISINSIFKTSVEVPDILLPIGISFYTFQQIAYLVSVRSGKIGNIDLIDYLAFILYFPKILMGPLADPADIIAQLNDKSRKKIDIDNLAIGVKLFSFGLFKKLFIADTFHRADYLIDSYIYDASGLECLLLVIFYSFEIYFDFSGYCDMAAGVSSMINIDLPVNFNSPYKAVSVRDFWKRWHMSLTKFFTEYIYIPLGGSKRGLARTLLNVMIVFLISGIWHGANYTFILWGVLYGVMCCLERLCDRAFKVPDNTVTNPFRRLVTFVIVSFMWLLFRSDDLSQFKMICAKIVRMRETSINPELFGYFSNSVMSLITKILHLDGVISGLPGFGMMSMLVLASVICFVPDNAIACKKKMTLPLLILAAFAFIFGVLLMGGESVFIYNGF